jgi:hypothetical protein
MYSMSPKIFFIPQERKRKINILLGAGWYLCCLWLAVRGADEMWREREKTLEWKI